MAQPAKHDIPTHLKRWERILFLSDIHVPYHDKALLSSVLEFTRWYKPNTVVWNGDILDCYALSSFVKDPQRKSSLQNELDIGHDLIKEFQAQTAKTTRHYYIPGNHEDRLERYLWGSAEPLAPLRCLKLGSMLGLEDLKVPLIPRTGIMIRSDFLAYHGTKINKNAGYTAKAELDAAGVSGISGHTHRLGSYRVRDLNGTREWYEQGCLCLTDPEYVIGQPNWSPGFVVGEFDIDSHARSIEVIPAAGGRFPYRGKMWV